MLRRPTTPRGTRGASIPGETFPGEILPFDIHHPLIVMNANRRWLLLFLCLLFSSSAAVAQRAAWCKKEGAYYFGIGLASLTAEEEYGFAGGRRPLFADTALYSDGEFGMTDITFQGELGITDWLSGVATTQYKVAVRQAVYRPTRRDTTASASGLGDLWLGARVRLLPREMPYAASVTVSMKLPTGSPYQEIPLGTGVLDYEIVAAAGSRFPVYGTIDGYAQLAGGFRLRNIASNELNYGAEVGINLNESLLLRMHIDGVHTTADFDRVADEPGNALGQRAFVADQSFSHWGLGLVYRATETMDLSLGYNWNGSGRNTLAAGGIAIGVAWQTPEVSE
jgi:hypothetical protein